MNSRVKIGLFAAFLAVVTAVGLSSSAHAQIPAGLAVTKVCAAATINVGQNTNCTITITNPTAAVVGFPAPLTVRIAGTGGPASPAQLASPPGAGPSPVCPPPAGVTGACGTPAGASDINAVNVTNPVNGTQSITLGCAGAFTGGIGCGIPAGASIVINESLTGTSGGAAVETVQFGGAAVPVGVAPAGGNLVVNGAAQANKVCTAGAAVNTANCTLTTTLNPGATTVTIAQPVGAAFTTATTASAGVTAGAVAGNTVTLTCAPVGGAANCPAVITETLSGVAPGSTVTQTGAAATTFTATATANVAAVNATKTCNATSTGGAALNTATCTLSVTLNAGTTTVTMAAPAGATFTSVTADTATVAVTLAAGANAFTATCTPAAGATTCPVNFTENITGAAVLANQTFTQNGTGATVFTASAQAAGPAGAPFITTISIGSSQVIPDTAAANADTLAQQLTAAGAAALSSVQPGASVATFIDLNDNEPGPILAGQGTAAGVCAAGNPAANCVATGVVTVTLSAGVPAGIVVGNPGAVGPFGRSTSVRCGPAAVGASLRNGCDGVVVIVTIPAALNPLPAIVSVNVTYAPDAFVPPQNTSAQANLPLFTVNIGVAAFAQPAAIGIICVSNTTAVGFLSGALGSAGFIQTFPTIAPGLQLGTFGIGNFGGFGSGGIGQSFALGFGTFGAFPSGIGSFGLNAIGVLPAIIPCAAVPVDATGKVMLAAPGTIEVSSINGSLVDASGNLTTNLRIGCGNGVAGGVGLGSNIFGVGNIFGATQIINFNDCLGVQFGVAGQMVGIVELRARYEPLPAAAAAGIIEVEGVGAVGFAAPLTNVDLLLDPNPITIGLTGTATARMNRVAVGCGTVLCVNPTTGLPIVVTTGSILNGTVVFTTDDPAIARFVGAVTGVPSGTTGTTAVPQNPDVTGFTTSANQAAVRCGVFPGFGTAGAVAPNNSGLATFFGGCDSASVQYQGVNPGTTNITATFIPDLPGAFGARNVGLGPTAAAVLGIFGTNTNASTATRGLAVVAAGPATTGTVALARGCDNVSPTVSETAPNYAKRVDNQSALVAIWRYNAASNSFTGWSPMAGAPNDLSSVTFLQPVFVCVNAATSLTQPPVAGPGGSGAGAAASTSSDTTNGQ